MKKIILPMLLAASVSAAPAMANTFDYGIGNASVKTGGLSYSGLTYNLGANLEIADGVGIVVDYASGKLKKTGQTDIDYSATYVGVQYAVFDMGDAVLALNLGSANVSTKQGGTSVATTVTDSGTRYGVGVIVPMSDTSELTINVDRDNSANITVTSADLVFAVGENMNMNVQVANATDFSAYSVGLTHSF